MKKILFLFLILFIAAPVFAVPGEYILSPDGNLVCDVSDVQQLRQKLKEEFIQKHQNTGLRGKDYSREVDLPVYKLLEQKRELGHCGFQK